MFFYTIIEKVKDNLRYNLLKPIIRIIQNTIIMKTMTPLVHVTSGTKT